jgi:hypothetical protein
MIGALRARHPGWTGMSDLTGVAVGPSRMTCRPTVARAAGISRTSRLANVRFLSGYRREWLVNQNVLDEMCSCSGQFAGMSIADAERSVRGYPRPLIRPALMHLLWRHDYSVNFDESLDSSMILEMGR